MAKNLQRGYRKNVPVKCSKFLISTVSAFFSVKVVFDINLYIVYFDLSLSLSMSKLSLNFFLLNDGQLAVKSWIHCYFCSCISSFIKFIDLRIFLAHLTDKAILSLFFTIFSGHFEESTPFSADLTVFMVIAQPVVCRLEKIPFRFDWDSLLPRLNSRYKARSYKKQKYKRIKAYRKSA